MVEIIKVVDVNPPTPLRGGNFAGGDVSIRIKHERLAVLRRYFRINYGKEVLFTYREIKESRQK